MIRDHKVAVSVAWSPPAVSEFPIVRYKVRRQKRYTKNLNIIRRLSCTTCGCYDKSKKIYLRLISVASVENFKDNFEVTYESDIVLL